MILGKKGYRIIFLATFLFGLYFETVLFLYFQIKSIKNVLVNDFVVIAALDSKSNPNKVKDEILKINGIENINYISSNDMLRKLENEDKDLYLSIKSMSINPIPDIMEIKLNESVLGNIDDMVAKISNIKDIIDIRYKPDEIVAIMHIIFYIKFLSLIISATLVVVGIIVFSSIGYFGLNSFVMAIKESFKWFLNGCFGVICAIIFVYTIIYPIKYISPLWQTVPYSWHVITLLCGGFVGMVLYQWKKN